MKASRIFPRALAVALIAGSALVAGCATPSQTGSTYHPGEARRPMSVQMATVQALRDVRIEQSQPHGVGTGAGAVIGGIAGSNIGGGRGAAIATVLGAVAGGVGGSYAERAIGTKSGVEITVRTDDGQTFAVVQQAGDERFEVGQRVRVLRDPASGHTRVGL